MKRIIRQDGPKATDRELALQKLRDSNMDECVLTEQESKAIHTPDFHGIEYEYSINHWLSRRSLALLGDLAELGIYGEDAGEVGAGFVNQALKQFAQHNVEPEQSLDEQLSEIDFPRAHHEGTIDYCLSAQSLYLLHRLAKLEVYGETMGEVGARFVDLALQGFADRPRFAISRNRSD
jgi:hypothetical protein